MGGLLLLMDVITAAWLAGPGGSSKQAMASTNQLPAVAGSQSETRSCHSWEAMPTTRSSGRSAHVHFGTEGTDVHNKQAVPPPLHGPLHTAG